MMRMFDARAWHYLAGYFRPRWPMLLACGLLAASQSLLVLPALYLVRRAFDTAIPRGSVSMLLWIGAGLLLARACASFVTLLTRWLALNLVKDAVSQMRQDLVGRLYALSHGFHRQADTDRLHTRIVQETERVDTVSAAILSGALPACFASLALLAVLVWLDATLVLLAIAIAPLSWFAGRITGRIVQRHVHGFHGAFEDFSTGIQFVLRNIDLTRLLDWDSHEQQRQHGHIRAVRSTSVRMAMSYAVHGEVHSTLAGLAGIVILVVGGAAVARHAMTLGEFLAFYVAAGMLNGYVQRIVNVLPELLNGNAALARLRLLHDAEPRVPYHGTRRIAFRGGVTLRNVTFGYGDTTVLHDLSLTIEPGETVAIVGANGAGKTTLLDLVVGFGRPVSGSVQADGEPYETLDLGHLRRSMGVVPQEPCLFVGSLRDNVLYGRPLVSEAELTRVLRLAQATEFIERLPDGCGTLLAEGGAPLSAGEAQRLTIARALLGDPRLLILDEPTTHLDVGTVQRVMAALVARHDRPGILVVSHDPAVICFADSVWRLDAGMLSPVETHEPVA